jgi:hypothetical protein
VAESTLRSYVLRMLKPVHGVAVENPACPGTPDVNCTHGWIELKALQRWPRSDTAIVTINHYTAKQRLWAHRRMTAGEPTFLLLRVAREYLLFTGANVQLVGTLPRPQLLQAAAKHWTQKINTTELISCLAKISGR